MSAPARRAKVDRTAADLSVRRQCALLNVARSGVYRPRPATAADDLALRRRIDELHLEFPFYGSRRMVFELNQEERTRMERESKVAHARAQEILAKKLGETAAAEAATEEAEGGAPEAQAENAETPATEENNSETAA